MAELKLSTIWEIKEYAKGSSNYVSHGKELNELRHQALPGVTWESNFYEGFRKDGFASFSLYCNFDKADPKSILANITPTVLGDVNGDIVGTMNVLDGFSKAAITYQREFVELTNAGMVPDVEFLFESDAVNKALRKDGSLYIRIDLTVLKISDLFKCRELLCGLLANQTQTDFDVKVGDESFKVHKSILAGTSGVFARMFESGLEEAADGALTLPDTTPAAFKAFTEAIYFDNMNFLSDLDLMQDVLHLTEKFDVGSLKEYCDESLAVKVDESNALEILTKSAALCNAEKTKTACIAILADRMEFKESEVWLDFKKRNRGVALEILDVVSDKWIDRVKAAERKCEAAERERGVAERERDAANADLKRKCEEEDSAKASSSKRRRK